MNNGEINNNVVPNTTNNTNTNITPAPAVPNGTTVTGAVVPNTQVAAVPASSVVAPNTQVATVPASSAVAPNTQVADSETSSDVIKISNQAPSVASTDGVILNSQPVLNPSTDKSDFTPTVVTAQNVTEVAPVVEDDGKKKKKRNNSYGSSSSSLTFLLFLLVIGMGFYIFYSSNSYKTTLDNLKFNCTPTNSSKEDKKLELDSTIVVELYNKVKTNIREDQAQPDFDDTMKLYLAFKQIPEHKFYSSNCNMFKDTTMEPYKCDPKKFTPKAFKEEDLLHELKVLFGEETYIPLGNVKLRNNCVGGYAYIKERGEFVEGKCVMNNAVSFSVDKKLIDAYTNRNTVTLVEEVKYKQGDRLQLPDYLKSGTYYYTFRLDMNFNYVLISKTYESKY